MVDVNLKVPALEKLMDYTASGIGAIAGPMLAPWKAGRESKAKLIEAKGQADRLKLIAEAQAEARQHLVEPDDAGRGTLEIDASGITQRIEFQEKKRQANIAATVRHAAAELGDSEVPEHEPNPDWTARFFDCVQDVSSEDMQKLWAKVLSGEVQGPGTTSLRTLDVLRNMTPQDAAMFQEVCSYVIENFVFKLDEIDTNPPSLTYGNLLILENAGLINAGPMLVANLRFKEQEGSALLFYQDQLLRITTPTNTPQVSIPAYLLTPAGKELRWLAESTPRLEYLRHFARYLHRKNCELSSARIGEKFPRGSFAVAVGEFTAIEPDDQTSGDAPP